MACLRVIAGPDVGQVCELRKPECVLGRHPDCDVAVPSAAASRFHARIVEVDGDYFLEDLHSRNGTYLNDELIRGLRRIGDGDRIRITDTVFAFSCRPPLELRKRHPLLEKEARIIMVDDEQPYFDRVSVPKRDATSGEATAPSHAILKAQMKALLEITQSLRKRLDLEQVLPRILDSLFVIFPAAERGFIVLESEEGELEPRWMKLRHGEPDETVRISRTIVRQVMQSQQGILSADAVDDSRFQNSSSLAAVSIRSVMCAPLVDNEGRSVGVVQIDTVSDRDRFCESDLEVLLSVATQASIAIDNARLHEYTLRQRAIERELEVADRIQRGFLPKHPPRLPDYEFFNFYQPARHVGGDFYDYVWLADGRLAVVVADVVGHGLGAAMLTAKLAAELRYYLLSAPHQPAEAISRLNASMAHDLTEGHFVTLALALLVPLTGELMLVNAGHPRPILRRADGRIDEVGHEMTGPPLGLIEDLHYRQCLIRIEPGDLILIYTDGVNEAMNQAKELYGLHRICARLHAAPAGARQLGQAVVDDLLRFLAGCPPQDDMCLLCFGRK